MRQFTLFVTLFFSCLPLLYAKGVYQTPAAFIEHAFKQHSPQMHVLWLSKDEKKEIADILSHPYKRLRIRYWQLANETTWILEEIGKEKPITIGVHIQDNQITELKVLTYRESRGDEVRHSFFTSQFNQVKLTNNNELDKKIDGITGATMSVRALSKVARLALWLNQKVKLS